MKKIEMAKQYDYNATTVFVTAAIALSVSSLLNYIVSVISSINSTVEIICQILVFAFMIFAYVMTIKGFSFVNKACKVSESNENYYLGKNLTVFSVLSLILSAILEIVALVFYMLIYSYQQTDELSADDLSALNNIRIITAIVVIAVQFVSIAVPYIFYLWKIHKILPKTDSANSFALFTMFVMIVQIAIAVLNSLYGIKGSDTSFLSSFTEILKVIEYLVLFAFFFTRRKGLAAAKSETVEK